MANKEVVIDIGTTGVAQAMHFDHFPLNFLGPMDITRASEIFYNTHTQQWDVILPGHKAAHPVASGFTGYDVARTFEVEWLQGARKEGVDPNSTEGLDLAWLLRLNNPAWLGRNDAAYREYYDGVRDSQSRETPDA